MTANQVHYSKSQKPLNGQKQTKQNERKNIEKWVKLVGTQKRKYY